MRKHFQSRLALLVVLGAGLALFVETLGAQAGPPTSLSVTRFDDPAGAGSCPSDCSLRQALAAIAPDGTVTLPAGTYTLSQGDLAVNVAGVTITGADARRTTIEQSTADRVLEVSASGTVTMSNVTISGGDTGADMSENLPGDGGGVLVDEGSTLDLTDSTVTGNTANSEGGGIYDGGTLTLTADTIESNDASSIPGGGGISVEGSATVTNTTFSGNSAPWGGGIFVAETLTLESDTLSGNSAGDMNDGDDLYNAGATTTQNSIFDDATSNGACNGAITTSGNNLDADNSCGFNTDVGDIVSTSPQLGALQDNGGQTDTFAPMPGSPAIGAANCSAGPSTDQRGVSRPASGCDIGSVQGAEGPIITSPAKTNVFDTNATLGADIDPNGADTSYVVEYGTSTAYGQQTSPVDIGTLDQTVAQVVGGLQPSTAYDFRVDATNANSTTFGVNDTFTTGVQLVGTAGSQVSGTLASGSGLCPASATVDWGDGSTPDSVTPTCAGGAYSISDAHTYGSGGHFDITVTYTSGDSPIVSGAGALISGVPGTAQTPPTVSSESVETVDGTTATLQATINPNGNTTSYVVDYGTSTSYGHQTASVTIPAPSGAQVVDQPISGLSPSTVYHFSFVATNSIGTTTGLDASFVTTTGGTGPTGGVIPPAAQGHFANLLPFLGTVLVNGKALLVGEQIPFGATIDTTHGTVVLVTVDDGVVQEMQFSGGIFEVTQLANGITLLVLHGGNFAAVCGSSSTHGARLLAGTVVALKPIKSHAAYTVRSLWGNGQGHFEVKGRYAAATVRGTNFHVADRCDGTLVHVRRGIVAVLDLVTNKTTTLTVGQSFLAPAKP